MYKGPLTHSSHYSEFVELTLNKNDKAFSKRFRVVIKLSIYIRKSIATTNAIAMLFQSKNIQQCQ